MLASVDFIYIYYVDINIIILLLLKKKNRKKKLKKDGVIFLIFLKLNIMNSVIIKLCLCCVARRR